MRRFGWELLGVDGDQHRSLGGLAVVPRESIDETSAVRNPRNVKEN
jgi:hypothetical protein